MDGLNFDFEFSITEDQKLKGGRKEGLDRRPCLQFWKIA